MARKQVGMVDEDLLDRADAAARALGQTRRTFHECALERHIEGVERMSELLESTTVSPRVAQPAGGVSPHLRVGNDSTSAQVKRRAKPAVPKRRKS